MSERRPTVAIVGAGLSGTLVAVNLLRYATRPLRIVMIERRGDFGPGVAYSTTDPQHRLNVPAARMSAFETAPLHLLPGRRNGSGARSTAASTCRVGSTATICAICSPKRVPTPRSRRSS